MTKTPGSGGREGRLETIVFLCTREQQFGKPFLLDPEQGCGGFGQTTFVLKESDSLIVTGGGGGALGDRGWRRTYSMLVGSSQWMRRKIVWRWQEKKIPKSS